MKSQEEKIDGNKKTLEEKIKPLGKIPVFLQVLSFVMYDVTTTSDN
jgi:hypothetical protein